MSIRQQLEQAEAAYLSQYAVLSKNTQGRANPETEELCDIRMEFHRDRDRIIHSKAFRRLKHKTQVFLLPEGDHYRTRLTHTLEVSQIARTIARGLQLNEDLTEAIALGHDLGHTPFGHAGENILNDLLPEGFEHNEQSLRVVDVLEPLNLTFEVRDGILNHKKSGNPLTLEGRIVYYADRIAYLNHDIDDAIRAQILTNNQLPKQHISVLGFEHRERINTMILDVINTSQGEPFIRMSDDVDYAMNQLREFMFENVYVNSDAKKEEKKVRFLIQSLYHYYNENPTAMSDEFVALRFIDGAERAVADYISCMTDRFAISEFEHLFVPQGWHLR